MNYNNPSFTGTPTLTISKANLTGSIANQSKVYGTDDPTLSSIGVALSGAVNTSVTNWMGNVTAINDTGSVAGTLTALARNAGEVVSNSPYAITSATFNLSGVSAGNYNSTVAFTGSPTLTISQANLTGTITNPSKVYGTNDPALSSIPVNLSGVINRIVSTWNGNVVVNDNGNVSTTLASLNRAIGEIVGNYVINTATLNALTGSAAGNYNSPNFTGSPSLIIGLKTLTIVPNSASKLVGTNDPLFTYNETGLVQGNVTNWMGGTTAINDSLSGLLSRVPGENVGSYPIIQGTLTANTNYLFSFLSNGAVLTINPIPVPVPPTPVPTPSTPIRIPEVLVPPQIVFPFEFTNSNQKETKKYLTTMETDVINRMKGTEPSIKNPVILRSCVSISPDIAICSK